ncbi:MAG: carbohydrate-binding domain-containing protein [Oscillospiraceae bacterium]|nr:carbohydrate-binding domain-containing protein [Oscillospiraceae bacterium]
MKSILHPFKLTSGILAAAAAAVCSLTVPAAAAASGDVNGDGKLTKNDAVQLQKWLLTADASPADWRAGDMNQDNILDARDLTLLKRQIPEEEEEPQYIHLKGSSISYEGDHIQVSGKTAAINASGTYYIDGSLKDGQILVQIPDETVDTRTVKLFLNGVDMTNGDAPCILIENAENTSVNLVAGTVNKLSDGKEAPQEEQEPAFAVLHAKDDLTIKGEGELLISAGLQYGIHCNNDLKITGGILDVTTGNADAIRGRTSVTIKDGTVSVDSEGDGIKATKGNLDVLGGTVKIKSGKDAMQADTTMELTGGSVCACGDRGLRSEGSITLDGCEILATATDNACETLGTTGQAAMQVTFVKQWAKNNPITLTVSGKQAVFEQNTLKKYRYALISSPELKSGTDYQLWAGGIQTEQKGSQKFSAGTPASYDSVNNTDHAELLYSDLFDQSKVHKIEVKMDAAKWKTFLEHSQDEEYYPCDVVIDGESFPNVGIRTKGHSSNQFIYQAKRDKYSFRIKMDKYNKYQNYHGLTEFCMNNMYSDPSCMRDILCYNAMYELDAYAPICAYTDMYLNGDLHSFYFLCEQPGTTLGERLATRDDSVLYKAADFGSSYDCTFAQDMDLRNFEVKFGEDENLSHITEIVNAINRVTPQNYKFIEDIIDVPSWLKGFAVNAVLCNYDSYNGMMPHNFYVEYNEGKMYYIGWDYNLSLGNFMDNGASVNSDINTGMYQADEKRRPMLTKLLAVSEYKKMYDSYVMQIVNYYSDPEKTVNGFATLIRSHVKADPRFLFTADKFESNIAKSPNGLQVSQNPGGMWNMWGGMWPGGGGGLYSYGGENVSIVDFMIKRNEVIRAAIH